MNPPKEYWPLLQPNNRYKNCMCGYRCPHDQEERMSTIDFQPIPGVIVLGLGHKARHGKDTVASAIVEAAPATTLRVGFADALYDYCRVEHGMGRKDPALLQRVGVEMRGRDPLTWIKTVYWKICDYSTRWSVKNLGVVVIPDVRFNNEAEFVRRLGGTLIKVQRYNEDGSVFQSADRDPKHVSECELDNFQWDYTIRNYDVASTRQAALSVVRFIQEAHAVEVLGG